MASTALKHFWQILVLLALIVSVLPACADPKEAEQRAASLEKAMWSGDIASAEKVLVSGPVPNVNSEDICWLHAAVILNLYQLIRPLVEADVPVNCIDTGMSPLQYAADNGRYLAAKQLIKMGADVNARSARNNEGELLSGRPLNIVMSNYLGIKWRQMRSGTVSRSEAAAQAKSTIRMLLTSGADPNLLDEPGDSTPLSISAQLGETEIVSWLLEAGANPNQISNADKGGVAPLETAIFNNTSNPETVEVLLYAGADPTAGPHADQLLEEAKENMPQVVPLLEQYGAR